MNTNMKNYFDFLKNGPILFVGCHPDDVELGCAGLLNRLRKKPNVYVLTLSKNQKNPKHKNLVKEQYQSLKSLGVSSNKIMYGDFVTREFSFSRQEICDFLIQIKNKINPTCVFVTPFDLHQDHRVCNLEAKRVFREQTLLEYHISISTTFPQPTFFVKLNRSDLNAKVMALKKFKTYKDKEYLSKESVTASCISPGIRYKIPICEAFVPVSIIV